MTFAIVDRSTIASVPAEQTTKILDYVFDLLPSVQDLEAMAEDALAKFEGAATTWDASEVGGVVTITVKAKQPPRAM